MKHVRICSLILALMMLLGVACDKSIEGEQLPNMAPEIYLSSAPPEGAENINYKVHFHWNGYDPDGRVDHFEYLITDDEVTGPLLIDEDIYETLDTVLGLDEHGATYDTLGYDDEDNLIIETTQHWVSVEDHHGVFTVSADCIPDPEADPNDEQYMYGDSHFLFRAQHTFFIRAVDEEGLRSSVPEHVTFTATTIAPEVDITEPADTGTMGDWEALPQDIFFRWAGNDSVGDGTVIAPTATRWAKLNGDEFGLSMMTGGSMLSLPEDIWSEWLGWDEVDPADPDGNNAGTRTLLKGLNPAGVGYSGEYLFLVQARDEANAITSHFTDGTNLKKIRVDKNLKPTIRIMGTNMPTRLVHGWTSFNIPWAEGQPIAMEWLANASSYGSRISGYRYGWDIMDTANDEEWSGWSQSNTSTSAVFLSGTHIFYLEAADYSGTKTRVVFRFHIVPFTMDYDLLLIDDYYNRVEVDPYPTGYPEGTPNTWAELSTRSGPMNARWFDIFAEYSGFNSTRDFIQIGAIMNKPPFESVAAYKRIIWEVRGSDASGLSRVARFVDPYVVTDTPYDYLSSFMEKSGQVLLCGPHAASELLPAAREMGEVEPPYFKTFPFAFDKYLKYSDGPASESETAASNFVLTKHFGVSTVTLPVDSNPRNGVPQSGTSSHFKTNASFWSMNYAKWLPEAGDLAQFGAPTFDIARGDTLFFSPLVYEWFDAAAHELMQPSWYDDPGVEHFAWGVQYTEVYDWKWHASVWTPTITLTDELYIPLLGYVPADSTTRWGENPAEVSIALANGEHRNEARYTIPGETDHITALISIVHPETPSVLMGFSPYYLEYETANNLIDYILVNIFGMD
ncbi:MAG: hypothetical protein GY835_09790 [bacterium]|nr:hypothetical protein [bacterium]